MTSHDPFAAAERIAPVPATRSEATAEAWVRHYAALSLAAFTEFHRQIVDQPADPARPDLGLLVGLAVAAMSAAHALHTTVLLPEPKQLWDLTPEYGALNGEWEEWLADTLDTLGINPADIDPRYNAGDFRSPSRAGQGGIATHA